MKVILFFSFVIFCVSCAQQDQYVYENVGTTHPVLVQKQSHQQKAKQTQQKRLVEKIESDVAKNPVVIKEQPKVTLVADNMGTQETDWVDIGTLDHKPKTQTQVKEPEQQPKTQRPKMKYYPSRYQRNKPSYNNNMDDSLRRTYRLRGGY